MDSIVSIIYIDSGVFIPKLPRPAGLALIEQSDPTTLDQKPLISFAPLVTPSTLLPDSKIEPSATTMARTKLTAQRIKLATKAKTTSYSHTRAPPA